MMYPRGKAEDMDWASSSLKGDEEKVQKEKMSDDKINKGSWGGGEKFGTMEVLVAL